MFFDLRMAKPPPAPDAVLFNSVTFEIWALEIEAM
jgi:hypothetical protein